jgi:uncharacterized Zn-binding protein involved in type VI secretion
LPSAIAGGIQSLSSATDQFAKQPVLNPAAATASLAQITQAMSQVGADGVAGGAPSAAGVASGQTALLQSTNAALTSAWTAASAVPGGQPAADQAYTQGIKLAAATAASSVAAALSGLADMHVCPLVYPPHGAGFVTSASKTVFINGLPACRQGDKILEAAGGSDPIAACPINVTIGG